ncbi:MAG TPA: regulatory iron-sulfur-containing complex subunit RicT [Bacteroidia bacterium]|nr:regulatory iron-sulfur-containing complex subunit RicT [Bacteroidia bacterium]HNT79048.1 regulatory iron-sulfur-containing complex subunit RicT [Bacteroidia bacterium]
MNLSNQNTDQSTEPPKGCSNHSTCGTSGCNKLNVYDWLSNMSLNPGEKYLDIVEVQFKGSRKEYFRNHEKIMLDSGDVVAVEGNPGHDIGTVSLTGDLVKLQLKKKQVNLDEDVVKKIFRKASESDISKWNSAKDKEFETMHKARKIALKLNLVMKLSDVEFQGDGKKATFFYTADGRVDFRELIKKLADEFRIKIEMRQVGMRQEASRLGGIGSCGRELCCSTWLTDFKGVSTSAARYQNLSLNPLKLAGQCGKLKCCLNYELDSYMDALKDIPTGNTVLKTKKGNAYHQKTDIFKRLMWFAYDKRELSGEDAALMTSDSWIMMSVDRVNEILEMNGRSKFPEDLKEFSESKAEVEISYADVVGQDSLTRMDQKKKKRKKNKNKRSFRKPSSQKKDKN